MSAYTTYNVNEMNIGRLLYTFQQRMRILLKEEARKHQMDAFDGDFLDVIENNIMPSVDYIVDWEPGDEDILDSLSGPEPALIENGLLDVMTRR